MFYAPRVEGGFFFWDHRAEVALETALISREDGGTTRCLPSTSYQEFRSITTEGM
jgi:hypothetical protein